MDGWIREEHTRSEADRVQNREIRRSSHGNDKKRMNWNLTDRDQLLNQDQIADKEMVIYL